METFIKVRFHSLIGRKTPQEYQLRGKTTVYRRDLNKYTVYSRKGVLLDVKCGVLMDRNLVHPVDEYTII